MKVKIHYLGENLFADKTPNNIKELELEFPKLTSLEYIWRYCQNVNQEYAKYGTRSLMVGDVIETEQGKFEISFIGFDKVPA